ncbi:ArsR/SmtB family transcription factor [Natrinema hispanicum]|uniref:ArsR/SmtB family transcription factor n=1 Tax=Natrinema hispanicum TaxID=392421 RepID=UPI00240816AC|nr:helix-turn-helix domain-containing protein [Natrinema hispanicum]
MFDALSSSTARSILMTLYEEPQTASDIANSVDTSLQNTKYHLDNLLDAGLIEIVDTWYSEHGREMKVYAPANGSLVVVASDESTKNSLREMLKRLLGAVGLLGVMSIAVDYVIKIFNRRSLTNGSIVVDEQMQVESIGGPVVPPGVLFFVGGLFVLAVVFAWWYWFR